MPNLKLIFPLICVLILASCKVGEAPSEELLKIPKEGISIIPKPAEMNVGTGSFITPAANILCFDPEAAEAAEWLTHMLKKANLDFYPTPGDSCGNWNLILEEALETELGSEGYILEINDGGVFMRAATSTGLFYAIQSLRQILPSSLDPYRWR